MEWSDYIYTLDSSKTCRDGHARRGQGWTENRMTTVTEHYYKARHLPFSRQRPCDSWDATRHSQMPERGAKKKHERRAKQLTTSDKDTDGRRAAQDTNKITTLIL